MQFTAKDANETQLCFLAFPFAYFASLAVQQSFLPVVP
jgi:hypothetical protein